MSELNVVDSVIQWLGHAYKVGLLRAHGSNFGWMPILPPPINHMGTSGNLIRVRLVQVCCPKYWATAAAFYFWRI